MMSSRRLVMLKRTGVAMQTAIGTYDHTKGLKDGSISTPGVAFEFVEV